MGGGGMGFGASLLSSFAMGFVGSMVANSFFSAMGGFGYGDAAAGDENQDAHGDQNADDGQYADNADYGDDGGFDGGGGDFEV